MLDRENLLSLLKAAANTSPSGNYSFKGENYSYDAIQKTLRDELNELYKTDKPVDTIRAETGFDTASTFNRNFKRLVGMSPIEWRTKKREKADYNISIYKGW